MAVERVGTLFNFQKTTEDFQRIQVQLATLRRQISTGSLAETFAELGSEVSRTLNLENLIDKSTIYIRENNLVSNRLQAMDLSLKQITDIAGNLRDALVTKRSPTGTSVPLTSISQKFIDSVKDRLNSQVEGRFLFAGSKTDTAPVLDSVTSSNIINNVPTSNYYAGDTVDMSVQISEELTIEYGIRADNQAFKDIFAALHTAIEGDASGEDEDLARAVDLATKAITELAGLRNKIGNDQKLLLDTIALQTSSKTFYEKARSAVSGTDIVKATTDVALNETILQASFQVFAKVSNLKLINFLT